MTQNATPETGGPATRRDRLFRWVRITVELSVIVVFVVLLFQNAELRRRPPTTPRPRPDRFAAGESLPPIRVVDKAGKVSTLDLDIGEGRKMLLIGDPNCTSCTTHLKELGADAVVLSVADPQTTRESPFAAFPGKLYTLAAPATDVRLRRVPQLVVVDSKRIVRTCADAKDCL